MAQTPSRFCPQCGAPVASGQRFCSNCGATMDVNMAHPTERAYEGSASMPTSLPQQQHEQSTFMAGGHNAEQLVPPPPPMDSLTPAHPVSQQQSSSYYTQYPSPAQGGQQMASSYTPAPPAVSGTAPSYARPQKDSSKRVLGQIGCGVLLVILLIVGLCAGAGYVGYRWIASQTNSTTGTNTGSTSTNGNNGTPTGKVITTQINQTIIYASDTITIVSVQQASSFSDDSDSNSQGVVRINVKETNNVSNSAPFGYSDSLRLLLPDKSAVAPLNTKVLTSPQAQTTQDNWWDFPAATNLAVDQMILQIGTADEAQMQVPLTGHANINQYQPETTNPNAKTQYNGLTWTITSAIESFNAVGKQAPKDMRYVTVNMSVDNTSSQDFSAYWGDYIRLKTGSSTIAPTTDTNFPTSFVSGSTGNNGTLFFLMPEGNTSFTLILLGNASASPPVSQATIDFQVS